LRHLTHAPSSVAQLTVRAEQAQTFEGQSALAFATQLSFQYGGRRASCDPTA
jgi:hypothetical protein